MNASDNAAEHWSTETITGAIGHAHAPLDEAMLLDVHLLGPLYSQPIMIPSLPARF